MTTFYRICIRDYAVTDAAGHVAMVTRGQEYLTSDVQPGGTVTVFSSFWWPCPVQYFAGEEKFT